MDNHLSQGEPDYKSLLSLANTTVMPVVGRKNSMAHEFEDGSVRHVNLSNSYFDIEIQFDYISSFYLGLINTLYHNSSKANGSQNTFLWQHPREDMAYVVRFMSPLKNVYAPGYLQSVDKIKLRVSAYYGQAIATYTDMRVYAEDGYCDFLGPLSYLDLDETYFEDGYMDFI